MSSFTLSNSSCKAMKCGPFTFQCACLICVCKSMASASRALHSSIIFRRVVSGRSFFVGYIVLSSQVNGRCPGGRVDATSTGPGRSRAAQRPEQLRPGRGELEVRLDHLGGRV